jgi:hypothetical protein
MSRHALGLNVHSLSCFSRHAKCQACTVHIGLHMKSQHPTWLPCITEVAQVPVKHQPQFRISVFHRLAQLYFSIHRVESALQHPSSHIYLIFFPPRQSHMSLHCDYHEHMRSCTKTVEAVIGSRLAVYTVAGTLLS